jgi:catechol 2,3-dioxygenase-like lactoylglutathione lyase family enzyme
MQFTDTVEKGRGIMDVMLIDHIGLNVHSLPISFEFYSRVFGFDILHRWKTTWLIQKGELKIGLFQRPAAAPICDLDQRVAISHFAFRTDRNGFERAQAELKQLGVSFEPPVDTGVALAIFFLDPDGHQIEITTFERDAKADPAASVPAAAPDHFECCRPVGRTPLPRGASAPVS